MGDLDDILSDEPIKEVDEPTELEPETADTVVEEPEKPAEPEPAVEEDPRDKELAGLKAALSETRGELRAFKAQQAQPQPEPAPLPDVIEDQQGFAGHLSAQVQQTVYNQKLATSKFLAVEKYGEEAVNEAYAYFEDNPAETSAFADHPSPFHAAVEAYKAKKLATEIGNDPEAYRERVRAELKAELDAQRVAQEVTQVGKAPSLASEPNLGNRAAPAWGGPMSLDDILG